MLSCGTKLSHIPPKNSHPTPSACKKLSQPQYNGSALPNAAGWRKSSRPINRPDIPGALSASTSLQFQVTGATHTLSGAAACEDTSAPQEPILGVLDGCIVVLGSGPSRGARM